MIEAAIFDMDGLLINSEPFWQQSEMEVFPTVGVALTPAMCLQTVGLRMNDMVQYWHRQFPWQNKTTEQVATEVLETVKAKIMAEGAAMEGVHAVLELLRNKGIRLALASSSPLDIIESVVQKLEIASFFEFLLSAENEEYGKPHPAVYLSAAKRLSVPPHNCIAFEDSLNGIISAKAARMKAVAVPEPHNLNNTRFDVADLKIASLQHFGANELALLNKY